MVDGLRFNRGILHIDSFKVSISTYNTVSPSENHFSNNDAEGKGRRAMERRRRQSGGAEILYNSFISKNLTYYIHLFLVLMPSLTAMKAPDDLISPMNLLFHGGRVIMQAS